MNMKLCYKYVTAAILVAALLLSFVFPLPALANPGLKVDGAILVADVAAGETITHTMIIGIGAEDPAMDMKVDVAGFGQSLDGSSQVLQDSEDTSPFSARSFITLDTTSFHLGPGDSKQVTATIRIPQDINAGGRYALIDIRSQPIGGEGNVGVIMAVNVPIALTIKGSQLIHEGKITGLTTSKAVSGQPVDIFTTFQNTGNHHFKIKGEVTVSGTTGETLATIKIPLSPSSVMPTLLRQLEATFTPQGELPMGVYAVKSKVMLEDGTVLGEASGSFEVAKPYVPPPPPASLTLKPSSASELKTTDGRISINFPQGSVISQVEISLRSYPLEQLPAPPTGFSLATTCFRVDGLTGLLAKDAVINVKYSPADLDKAEGDATKLVLVRWDESTGQWTVLKTSLDVRSMTLSVSTNQFSIWAVMVGKPAATLNWVLIGSIIGILVIVLVVLFVKVVKPRLRPR